MRTPHIIAIACAAKTGMTTSCNSSGGQSEVLFVELALPAIAIPTAPDTDSSEAHGKNDEHYDPAPMICEPIKVSHGRD